MIYFVIPYLANTAHLTLGYVHAPLSLLIKLFKVAHAHELRGHRAENPTYNRVKRYFYWSGMFNWIELLMLDY